MLRTGDAVQLSGVVDTITFRGQNGFAVIRIKVDDQFASLAVVHPTRKIAIATGPLGDVAVGSRLTVEGVLSVHHIHGPQVDVKTFTISQPKGESDIARFIAAEVNLIGRELAGRIVKRFGEQSLHILDNDIDRLAEVNGIGRRRVEQIKEAWAGKRDKRQVLFFLSSIGLTGAYVDRVFDKYGTATEAIVRQNPYCLARDVKGIGFVIADRAAKMMGIEEVDPRRIHALCEHALTEGGESKGHCFLYQPELVTEMLKYFKDQVINAEGINAAIEDAIARNIVTRQDNRIYVNRMAEHEDFVVDRLIHILRQPKCRELQGENLNAAFAEVEGGVTLPLSPEQRQAVYAGMACKVFVMTGNPGVGKTTITKEIVRGYQAARIPAVLLAPTGKAARRMAEVIGVHASTVHRVLFELDAAHKAGQELEDCQLRGVIILDEWSMADVSLMAWLLKFVHESATLVFVGDKDQLPSVGPGSVLRDLMDSRVIPSIHLTQIFRQAAESNIIMNAHRINAGQMPVLAPMQDESFLRSFDMVTYESTGEQSVLQAVLHCVMHIVPWLGYNSVTDSIVLAPTHRGVVGVQNFNSLLQRALNPSPADWIERAPGVVWGIGDRVMQFKNNYKLGVFNGDQGTIVGLQKTEDNDLLSVDVSFDGNIVRYLRGAWNELSLCYASTIHKVQGCEYPVVIVIVDRTHGLLLQKNLLYTAITRGRKKVILIYDQVGLRRCINNVDAERRNTFLAQKLWQANSVPE